MLLEICIHLFKYIQIYTNTFRDINASTKGVKFNHRFIYMYVLCIHTMDQESEIKYLNLN